MLTRRALTEVGTWTLIYFACWLTSFAWIIGDWHLLRQYFVWCFTLTGLELPFAVLLVSLILFLAILATFFIVRRIRHKRRASA